MGRALAALVLAGFLVLCVGSLRRMSATIDEAAHLHAGWRALTARDFSWNNEHPPLGKVLAAVPLLSLRPVERFPHRPTGFAPFEPERAQETSVSFLFRDNPPTERMLFLARLPVVTLGLALVVAVGIVARARYGGAAGLAALSLAAFDPNLLGHSGLVTTDVAVAVFSFLAVVLFSRALGRGVLGADLVAGVVLGLAQASKYTALLLYPLLGLLALLRSLASRPGRRLRPLVTYAVACATSFFALWACYAFETGAPRFEPEKFSSLPETLGIRSLALALNERAVPLPSYLWGLRYTVGFSRRGGWPAFLLGEDSQSGGFLGYYPVAFLVKTPLATLALLATSFALRGRWRFRLGRDGDLLFSAAFLFAAAVQSGINIGVRHILPVYPFLFVLASRTAQAAWTSASRWARGAVVASLGALVASAVAAFPHFIAYFHEAVGGPEGGRRILLDSNLDWGQGLIELREHLDREGIEEVRLHYFGTALPEAYGIAYEPMTEEERYAPAEGAFAVSVMSLANVCGDKRRFAWLKEIEPDAKVGHAIWVWDLRPGRRRAPGEVR